MAGGRFRLACCPEFSLKQIGLAPSEFAAAGEAGGVAEFQEREALVGEVFGAGQGSEEGFAGEVALGGFLEVVVPDVGEGVVEADALEAVVEADGPVVLAGEGGEDGLG